MPLTVRQVLELSDLRKAKVVAGFSGLDRLVLHLNVLEIPEIDFWVKPGCFFLSTLYAVRGDVAAQVQLLSDLDRRQAAALAVDLHPYLGTFAPQVLQAADELGFPLLELATDNSYVRIMTAFVLSLHQEQYAALEKAYEATAEFMQLMVDGSGLAALIGQLKAMLHAEVGVVDEVLRLQAVSGGGGDMVERSTQALSRYLPGDRPERAPKRDPFPLTVDGSNRITVAPLQAEGQIVGYCLVEKTPESLTELEWTILGRAATAAASMLARSLPPKGSHDLVERRALLALLMGDQLSHDTPRGLDISGRKLVMVVEQEAPLVWSSREWGPGAELERLVSTWLRGLFPHNPPPVLQVGAAVAVLPDVGRRKADAATGYAQDLGRQLVETARASGAKIVVGIGELRDDPLETAKSYTEARIAADLIRRVPSLGPVASYHLVQSYHLAQMISEHPHLRDFALAILAPLATHEHSHQSQLVDTLEVLVNCGGNQSRAARALFIDRGTLRYRLKKATDLLGFDPLSPAGRDRLALALKVMHFV